MSVTESTYLRRLPVSQRIKLVEILDVNENWRKLAAVIKNPEKPDQELYTHSDLSVFTSRRCGQSAAESLLKDWETRGRLRPTVKVLHDYLVQVKLYRASDYISTEILKAGEASKRPETDPAEVISLEILHLQNSNTGIPGKCDPVGDDETINSSRLMPSTMQSTSSGISLKDSDSCSNVSIVHEPDQESSDEVCGVTHFSYARLLVVTRNFTTCIGKGAFGEVYWGEVTIDGVRQEIAVKKLTFDVRDQFTTELRVMTEYKHPNLLPLLGYSNDNLRMCCLITPFMANGSLDDRLSQKNGTPPLDWKTRLNVAAGTAKGIVHLHTHGKEPLVHRDIKSANILLDEKFDVKVGDFGIVRIGGDWQKTTKKMTSRISGTCAYMSNEAFHGNVTVKMDTFSFGIVLLELLTGLAADNPSREDRNLLSHVKDAEGMSAQHWKDPKAGDWPDFVVEKILDVAFRSTKGKKRKRLLMEQVLEELEEIVYQTSKI